MQVASLADLDTATWLSRILGNETVAYATDSHSSSAPSSMFSGGQASETSGTGTHLAARALLTPDEAMRMRPDLQVLLRPGKRPSSRASSATTSIVSSADWLTSSGRSD